jgi:hypothetical protein
VNDASIDRLITDALEHAAPAGAPEGFVAGTLDRARTIRPRPRWLAIALETPMTRPPTVLVGSPTARAAWLAVVLVLATAITTLALVAGGVLPRRDLAIVTPSLSAFPSSVPAPTTAISQAPAGRPGLVAYSALRTPAPGASPCPASILVSCRIVDAWVANADGTDAHLLLPGDHVGTVLGWTADGSRLLSDGGSSGLRIADASGTILQTIDPHALCPVASKTDPYDPKQCTGSQDPALSPDGTRLAFVRQYPNDRRASVVAVLDLTNGNVKELTQTRATNGSEQCWNNKSCEGQDELPRWSPDGSRIAFARQVISPEVDGMWTSATIFTIAPDGSDLQRVTPKGMYAYNPSWSPDGRSIAFTNEEMVPNAARTQVVEMRTDIWTIGVDGSGARRLTTDGGSYLAGWTLDGQRVTFVRDNANWVMAADGSSQLRLGVDLEALSAAGCMACVYPRAAGPVALWQPIP